MFIDGDEMNRNRAGDAPHNIDTGSLSCSGRPSPQTPLDSKTGRKRRSKDFATVTPTKAWSYSEASAGKHMVLLVYDKGQVFMVCNICPA